MKHIKLYEQYNGTVNVFDNVPKEYAKQIAAFCRLYSKKGRVKELIPSIADYLHSEFSWAKENEVVDVLHNGAKTLWQSVMPYHEVVEWLAHGGESDTWDWAHPIAVDMTGNRLKQMIPELLPYTNEDIQEGSVPYLHGSQRTGNPLLDNDRTTKEDLTKTQREVYDILNEKYKSAPMFTTVQSLLEDLLNDYKRK
jgi:hypothetical protein